MKGGSKGSGGSAETAKPNVKVPPRAVEDYVALSEKIFIGAIPRNVTEEAIWSFFIKFGVVVRVEIKTDRAGQPKGFGFVTFESLESAQAALDNYENNIIGGKWIDVKNSSPSDYTKEAPVAPGRDRPAPTGATLRAQGLPFKISPREILVLFRDFNVLRATTTADKFGRASGIAIVEFADAESCLAAFHAKQGATIEHRYIELFECNAEYMRRAHPMNTCSAQELWGWSNSGPSSIAVSSDLSGGKTTTATAGTLGPIEEFLAAAGYNAMSPEAAGLRSAPY